MTKNKILITAVAVLVVFGAFYFSSFYSDSSDYKKITYTIDGKSVAFAPDRGDVGVRYFGNEITKDFNGDGREDVAFIIVNNSSGSGVFYYVVAALNTTDGYKGSEAFFLGDRIAPQITERGEGRFIIVNYADRKPDEPMTATPTVGKSVRLILDSETLEWGTVESDFEGEADPSRMTLDMKAWTWVSTELNDGSKVIPKKTGVFSLDFGKDGAFSGTTDCNRIMGSYTANKTEGTLSFGNVGMTKMFCEGSEEQKFVTLLGTVSGYHFTSKGELILDLKFDSGTALFR